MLQSTYVFIGLLIFANVDETYARKRSDAFKRFLKQIKLSFNECLTKLAEKQSSVLYTTGEEPGVHPETDENVTALVLRNDTSEEERYKIIRDLQTTMMERLNKVPPGKLKIAALERFKKELIKTVKFIPKLSNDTEDGDEAAKTRDALIEKLTNEVEQLKEQERMYDPKKRRRAMLERERSILQDEMNKTQRILSADLERRSKLQFPENVANNIRGKKSTNNVHL